MSRFRDRRILVTGAASGIGRAACLLFAAEGGRVLAVDIGDGVEETAQSIVQAGGHADAMRADAGDEADIKRVVAHAVAAGGLDVIFANAGVSGGEAGIFEQTADAFAEILRVNLMGPFLAIKHGGPVLIERGGGAIVCTASIAGLRAGAGGPAYSASKAGVINLVQLAAQQFTGTGVRVNAVCPGLVETGMTRRVFERARERGKLGRIGELTPLRRSGRADEVARAALFLASDEASFITGQALPVDGGLSTSHPFGAPRAAGPAARERAARRGAGARPRPHRVGGPGPPGRTTI